MPSKMFLRLNGVQGDSKAPRHFGEIEISEWFWGGTQRQQTLALGIEQGVMSKNLKSDLTIKKLPDRASQFLIEACTMERLFAEAILTTENTSGSENLLRSMIIKLKIAVITSVASSAGVEIVTFDFEKIEISYPSVPD